MSSPKSNGMLSVGKWLTGIAAAVIGGLVVWWLTSPGFSPLIRQQPSMRILDMTAPSLIGPGFVKLDATAYNDGSALAEGCNVVFRAEGQGGEQLKGLGRLATQSAKFDLEAKGRRSVTSSLIFSEPAGTIRQITLKARAVCDNDTSPWFSIEAPLFTP